MCIRDSTGAAPQALRSPQHQPAARRFERRRRRGRTECCAAMVTQCEFMCGGPGGQLVPDGGGSETTGRRP
eukprot:1522102-Prymnesium_polylepis.1